MSSDNCPKCGAAALPDCDSSCTVFDCCAMRMDGDFYNSDTCRIRQLEGLLRRVLLAIDDDYGGMPERLTNAIRDALEAPK